MSPAFNADSSVNRTRATSKNSAMPGTLEQECQQPLALLPRNAVQCSQLAETGEKWLEVPCTGGIKVPGWVNRQNCPM